MEAADDILREYFRKGLLNPPELVASGIITQAHYESLDSDTEDPLSSSHPLKGLPLPYSCSFLHPIKGPPLPPPHQDLRMNYERDGLQALHGVGGFIRGEKSVTI